MTEPYPQIEILGQKLSYPTTIHGAVAVSFFFVAVVLTFYLFTQWATPKEVFELQVLINKVNDEVSTESKRNVELQQTINKRDKTIQQLKIELDYTIEKLRAVKSLTEVEKEKLTESAGRASAAVDAVIADQTKRQDELRKRIADQMEQINILNEVAESNPTRTQVKIISGQQQQRVIQFKTQLEALKHQQNQQQQLQQQR